MYQKPFSNQDRSGALDQPTDLTRAVSRREFIGAAGLAGVVAATFASGLPLQESTAATSAQASQTALKLDESGAIVSLRYAGDQYRTDYIEPGARLGEVHVRYRRGHETAWRTCSNGSAASSHDQGGAVAITSGFAEEQNALVWTVSLRNTLPQAVEIGDLALPLPMNTTFKEGQPATASVLKHSFISGHGSHIFWMRSNSVGPYLCFMPTGGAHLEYWDARDGSPYRVYVHSAAAAEEVRTHGGRWRQPQTSAVLAPYGSAGDTLSVSFRLQWVHGGYPGLRDCFVEGGLIDVAAAPGMTVPVDLPARLALRTRQEIHAVEPEFGEATRIVPRGRQGEFWLYDVRFERLGENRLTVSYGGQAGGRATRFMYLEFFVTEPVETLINKRAAFTARHQHRDPSKWYDGLLAEWDMSNQTMLSPDNYDKITGWRIYEVTCDDPGLSKPAYLAAKSAEHPVQSEVEALDYYIRRFVWGGLQRTDAEAYPYGIYGIPDWKTNRDSSDPGTKGKLHLWRCYDYPHVILMYYSLYRVAKHHPSIKTELTARQYLERAAGTAKAFFTVPNELVQWSPYETGYYNELIIPELIDALAEDGMPSDAAALKRHWEKKVKFFVTGDPNLFGSEYAFDSTGFESTHAMAKYALAHAGSDEPDSELAGIGGHAAKLFMRRQMAANLFCRGWLEPAYYLYGSDYRASGGDAYTLSYMAQMGGWAVLDYALRYADDPFPYLHLGYASILSSWALMNAGTDESNYGYWYPGEANDGGAGGGFEPAANGFTWLDQPHHRGSWYYSCEINLGYCAALRAAAAVVADDPALGRVAYGALLSETRYGLEIIPRDGVRRRFHVIGKEKRLHVSSDPLRFSADRPIVVSHDQLEIIIPMDAGGEPADRSQPTTLRLEGLAGGSYLVRCASHCQIIHSSGLHAAVIAQVPVPHAGASISIRRT